LLEQLSQAAARLVEALASAVGSAGRFEPSLRARVDAGTASTSALGEELRRLGAREAEVRRFAGEAAKLAGAVEVETARLSTERADLERRLPQGAEIVPLSEVERTAVEATVARLERRLEALGQVNPLAAEELERERAHLSELSTQREDVERSLAELEGLVRELAETVERRFEETYAAVERHFTEIVATLFPGGEGRLRLTLPEKREQGEAGTEEPAGDGPVEEPGVEVELRPAGKKVTRLSLLSGGEKALGALSFLFALFLARPCPFYLLDEVEAALDDTNITRFVDLLRRYSDHAQFIVITHQKRTMEAADILYGVTMGSDGVSQIVSKRLRGADTAVAISA
jgi:chromosome segregation protein